MLYLSVTEIEFCNKFETKKPDLNKIKTKTTEYKLLTYSEHEDITTSPGSL